MTDTLLAKANVGAGTDNLAVDLVPGGAAGVVKVALGVAGVVDGYVSAGTPMPITKVDASSAGTVTTQNLVPAGTATTGSAVEISTVGKGTVAIQVEGTYTGVLSVQARIGPTSAWVTLSGGSTLIRSDGSYSATIASAQTGLWQVDCGGFIAVRVTGLAAMTGTATVSLRATDAVALIALDTSLPTGSAVIGAVTGSGTFAVAGVAAHSAATSGNPVQVGGVVSTTVSTAEIAGDVCRLTMSTAGQVINKQFSVAEQDWMYPSAAGGITNTTDVTVRAAQAAGIRNYITGISVVNGSSTVATEFVIKDGATIIWRGFIGTGLLLNSTVGLTFPTPLKGTAATAINVACLTTGAQVYFNCQGYSAP